MKYLGWLTIAATLIASTLSHPKDKGPQIFERQSIRSLQKESPRQPRHQKYQEVIMYLTPSQIQHLEETQSEHGMILPTAQSQQENNKKELLEQQVIKHESSHNLDQQFLKKESSEIVEQEFLKQGPSQNFEQLLEKESSQNQQQQLEQNLHQQLIQEEANRNLEQQLFQQATSQNKEQQLLKQEYERQQSQNQTNQEFQFGLNQNLEKYGAQQIKQSQFLHQPQFIYLNQQRENNQNIALAESKQLFYPEPNFIKFIQQKHETQQLNPFVQYPQRQFKPYQDQPQLQFQLHPQPQIELRLEPQIQYLQPQIQTRPESQINVQSQQQIESDPKLQLQLRPQNQIELLPQQQIELPPQPQIELIPQLEINSQPDSESKLEHDSILQQNFRLIPYQYIPEQQDAHRHLGQQIFQNQLQFIQDSNINSESELVNLKNKEEMELGKQIVKQHLQYLHKESNRQAEAILKEQRALSKLNEQVAMFDQPQKEQNEEKPVYKQQNALPRDTPKIQDLTRLDLLQSLQNDELHKLPKFQVTHLDLLKPHKDLAHLQYAPSYNDQKFSLADIENVIQSIQAEKRKAQETINSINKSPPVVVKEENVIKHRPIELIKTVKVPVPAPYLVPQPFEVKVPQPFAVPLEIIKPYAVPIVKTEKVEVEKPVPVEVEKRVPYEVEKKVYVQVNKPYTVERIVPVEIKKEVPVEIPIYKPQKLTILRHIWEH